MTDSNGTRASATWISAGPDAKDAVAALLSAVARGDEDWTYAVMLEVRDRLREALSHSGTHTAVKAGWASCPDGLEVRWHVMLAAFVGHEFKDARLTPPRWTVAPRLEDAWVLDTPRLTEEQVREQSPTWLSGRNIFIATKDLGTL